MANLRFKNEFKLKRSSRRRNTKVTTELYRESKQMLAGSLTDLGHVGIL